MRFVPFILALLVGSVAQAGVRASLPLQGYSRPGYFIPVKLEGTTSADEIQISGDGVATTRVAVGRGAVNVIVPVLTIGSADGMLVREGTSGAAVPVPPAAHRSVADGVLAVGTFIGDATITPRLPHHAVSTTVSLDPIDPVPGPAIAWEALDILYVDGAAVARMGDDKLIDLLEAGVTIVSRDKEKPSSALPWTNAKESPLSSHEEGWILQHSLRGPRGSVFGPALRPVEGQGRGLSPASRHNVLIAAVLFTILATGVGLLLRSKVAVMAMAGLVVITLVIVYAWWSRQPPYSVVGGSVVIEETPLTQVDGWTYYLTMRATTISLPAGGRPIVESLDALARLRPSLACAADGTPIGFDCVISADDCVAVLSREVTGTRPTGNVELPVTSPLLGMVKRGYLQPLSTRVAVAGQVAGRLWPGVVVRTVTDTTRPASAPEGQ